MTEQSYPYYPTEPGSYRARQVATLDTSSPDRQWVDVTVMTIPDTDGGLRVVKDGENRTHALQLFQFDIPAPVFEMPDHPPAYFGQG
jgi:hypothetical protein